MSYAVRVNPGSKVDLASIDPNANGGLNKDEGEARIAELAKELDELEDLMFFAGKHSMLLVLQGMDTSGKDGTIRFLFQHMNAPSAKVASFKVPTPIERAHDFLWRVHSQTPGAGEWVIFNRSHYEDVLVVRVHELVPKSVWSRRYDHINAFEAVVAEANTIIVKCFLHIDKDEQEARLLAREQEVEKSWKLSVGDWKEREFWDDYQAAYEDALSKCSTEIAAWHVIPANRKWFRNLAILELLVETLRPYQAGWLESLEALGESAKAELAEYKATLT